MATPIPAAVTQATQQVAQQQATRPDVAAKAGPSSFDKMMADKVDASMQSKQVAKVQASEILQSLQKTNHATAVQKTGKADDLKLHNATSKDKSPPVTDKPSAAKATNVLTNMMTTVETRNVNMGKFINECMTGKMKLNQQQLLGLQAKVSEYSLELDLTGKVVEKATNGLKDTLRTQV